MLTKYFICFPRPKKLKMDEWFCNIIRATNSPSMSSSFLFPLLHSILYSFFLFTLFLLLYTILSTILYTILLSFSFLHYILYLSFFSLSTILSLFIISFFSVFLHFFSISLSILFSLFLLLTQSLYFLLILLFYCLPISCSILSLSRPLFNLCQYYFWCFQATWHDHFSTIKIPLWYSVRLPTVHIFNR